MSEERKHLDSPVYMTPRVRTWRRSQGLLHTGAIGRAVEMRCTIGRWFYDDDSVPWKGNYPPSDILVYVAAGYGSTPAIQEYDDPRIVGVLTYRPPYKETAGSLVCSIYLDNEAVVATLVEALEAAGYTDTRVMIGLHGMYIKKWAAPDRWPLGQDKIPVTSVMICSDRPDFPEN